MLLTRGWGWSGGTCVVILAILGVVIAGSGSAETRECNQTIHIDDLDPSDDSKRSLTFTLPSIGRSIRGRPFYCWFRFEGTQAQYVLVDVTVLKVGDFNPELGSCEGGYLRISDSDTCSTDTTWFPPTEICGKYDKGHVRVKRYTRSPLAFVEYRVDKAKSSKSYQFDVEFLDIAEDLDSLPYGHLQRQSGRVANTKCDWLIDVDECIGHCNVISPGYPGIYPPNTRCRYLFVSFSDARVALQMGGITFNGKFDMKKSENCSESEDYVEVFDGMSSQSSTFGRFCGHDGHHLVSSGEGLLLIFQSGVGGPPWDYSGFDLRVTDMWKNEHEGGTLVPETVCDWVFESRGLEDGEGSAHTPDHMLKNSTSCNFEFRGLPNERLQLELVVRKLDPDCAEYLEVLEDNKVTLKICAKDIANRGKKSFFYNSTTTTPIVRFVKTEAQLSNVNPSWIYFVFGKGPDPVMRGAGFADATTESEKRTTATNTSVSADAADAAESRSPGSGSDGSRGSTLMTSTLLMFLATLMTSVWK